METTLPKGKGGRVMTITYRQYNRADDYQRVDQFLITHHQQCNMDGNWLQPAWEYMHSHPFLDTSALDRIRLWEEDGQIVGVAHYESRLGEVFFQLHPAYLYLKPEILDYAEEHLAGHSEEGQRYVQVFVNDYDADMIELVESRGYIKDPSRTRPIYRYVIPEPFPAIRLPQGFRLTSLAEDNNWVKIDRVLWRGFDHPGEPPADKLEERKLMQDTPNFDHSLKIVVEAPNGDFAAFSGLWYECTNRYAYVEPVATDPDYRRMGLGKAAVLEGIRRCAAMGAGAAYVGSDQAFYQSLGFKKVFNSECWVKYLDD
jgi:GNAT superfamily N-acetyltransferase